VIQRKGCKAKLRETRRTTCPLMRPSESEKGRDERGREKRSAGQKREGESSKGGLPGPGLEKKDQGGGGVFVYFKQKLLQELVFGGEKKKTSQGKVEVQTGWGTFSTKRCHQALGKKIGGGNTEDWTKGKKGSHIGTGLLAKSED